MFTDTRRIATVGSLVSVLLLLAVAGGDARLAAQTKPAGKLAPRPSISKPVTGPGAIGLPSFIPGVAKVELNAQAITLSNAVLSMTVRVANGILKPSVFVNQLTRLRVSGPREAFALKLADGRVIPASVLRVATAPRIVALPPEPRASRFADRQPGKGAVVALDDPEGRFTAMWRAVLRDGSNYVRQVVTVRAGPASLAVAEFVLVDVELFDPRVAGPPQGSPVVTNELFAAVEHPLGVSQAERGQVRAVLPRSVPIPAGRSFICSSVIGVVPAGQLRRGFLNYVERERARPSRPFLQYSIQHDVDRFSRYDETAALGVLDRVGTELVRKRGATVDAFLLDDGWDDPNSPWQFNTGFPRGFSGLAAAAKRFGASAGVWMSPLGGYGRPKEDRIRSGVAQGFEAGAQGLALSGPAYFGRLRSFGLDIVRRLGIGSLRLDGVGGTAGRVERSEFDSDTDAAIALLLELRAVTPSLFVDLAADTWLSPFWLLYADSVWRGGADVDFAGVGPDRQQWITYRDAQTYERVVKTRALTPLSALSPGGLLYARHASRLDSDPDSAFQAEVRSFFGSGAQSQTMSLAPDLLKEPDWDAIAEAANWARRRSSVLRDTHWIGGDPKQLQVYGWASWSPDVGIIVLRNPSDQQIAFDLDVQRVFELPEGTPRRYIAASPWKEDRGRAAIELVGGRPYRIELAPFRVLVLEATPSGAPAK